MKVFEAMIDIDAPRATVWQHLTDFSSYPQWNPFIVRAEGELKQGNVIRFRASAMPITISALIASLIPEEEFIWEARFPLPGMNPRYIRQLQSLDDGRTRFINREEFTGFLVPLMTPILNSQAGIYQKTCEALKARVETAVTA
ncbi:MAG: SRPBCC domain-containing protein [Aggregatilineales bacterium]